MTTAGPLDEMVDGRGGVRPHWRGVLAAVAGLGEGGLAERSRRLQRVFEEEGDATLLEGGEHSAWRCDPVPLPLSAVEFATIEAGLTQRAQLLQAILNDLYGPQLLLSEGLLPPALVYPNPGFSRACREQKLGPGPAAAPIQLHGYAADLVRHHDGSWRVLADLVCGPSGIGFARENRRLLGRVVPEAFRLLQVQQLRPFFDVWQDSLQRLAQPGTSNTVVALLTPGTGHPDWFEHMLLARELSCALVEGGDLTLRNGRLFLKTLRGLQPIDLLLNRVPAELLDPLELNAGSAQGIPGLMDALRHGAVRMVNHPGVGLLEAPGLRAFLPTLAQHLLGEPLKLDSVPTRWLGDLGARNEVLAEIDQWEIGPAAIADWSQPDPHDVTRRVLSVPARFAATARVTPSMTPCASAKGLAAQPIVLRVFMVHDGVKWRAMPGGIGRVMDEGAPIAGRANLAPRSVKDVWVLYDEERDIVGPAAVKQRPLPIRRTTGDLPGRVAENFFWLGRYLERLEGAARLVRTTLTRVGRDMPLARDLAALEILSGCLAASELIGPETSLVAGPFGLTEALLASVGERGPLTDLIEQVTRLTQTLRDRLTADMYAAFVHTLREMLDVVRRVKSKGAKRSLDELAHALVTIIRFTATVSGLAAENMVQGGGRLFLDLGRRIERAQSVASVIAAVLDRPSGRDQSSMDDRLRLILELCDSAITYRNRYLMVLQPATVLDLVIADDGNPRGLVFQLDQISSLLSSVVGLPNSELAATCDQLQLDAIGLTDRIVAASDQTAATSSLPKKLRGIEAGVGTVSEAITRQYFALLPPVQSVGVERPDLRGAA
jgi:uncharacterized circularly permuted ATP-grasp superfamily protein/uncharacterized alpha-E superfamily protein